MYIGVERVDLRRAERETQLLFGEKVRVLALHGDHLFVEALEQPHFNGAWTGYRGWIPAIPLLKTRPHSPKVPLDTTLETCLDTPYVRGGLSPRGIDCSGLVHLAYRKAGHTLPRNAHDQWLASTPITPSQLKPGYLFFKPDGDRMIHVLLYLGEERYIEATTDVYRVRTVTLEEKYGKSRDQLLAEGCKLSSPAPNIVLDQ